MGVAAFLILYFSFYCLDKEHIIFRIGAAFFFLILLMLIGRVAMDNADACDIYLINSTEIYIYGENYTDYHYDDYGSGVSNQNDDVMNLFHRNITNNYGVKCVEDPTNTGSLFYDIVLWFLRLFVIYLLIYYSYKSLKYLQESARINREK